MNKNDRLCGLRELIINAFGKNEYNVVILINTEENYLSAVYDGRRVCKITDLYSFDDMYHVIFTDDFSSDPCLPQLERCANTYSIVNSIEKRIVNYNKKKGQENKNMANRRFIVEKMEVEHKCCEPDVINMTIRQEPDGIIHFQTARELRTLIESVDPDKLSADNKIAVNIDISNDAIVNEIHMMTARGSGKTRWVSEQLKNAWPCKNNIKNNIKDVIFNDPATIVFWTDGTKTVVKCQPGETFDPEKGLAIAISKRMLGNDYGYYETFAKHVGRYNKKHKEK